jgi:predicted DNA-binding protein
MPRRKENRIGFATTLPPELLEQLREESERTGVPQSKLVERFIEQGLSKTKKRGK